MKITKIMSNSWGKIKKAFDKALIIKLAIAVGVLAVAGVGYWQSSHYLVVAKKSEAEQSKSNYQQALSDLQSSQVENQTINQAKDSLNQDNINLQKQIDDLKSQVATLQGKAKSSSSQPAKTANYLRYDGSKYAFDYPEGATVSTNGEVFAVGNINYLIQSKTLYKIIDGKTSRTLATQEDFNNGVINLPEAISSYKTITVDGVLAYQSNSQLIVFVMKNGKTYQARSLVNNSFNSTDLGDPVFARFISSLIIK